MKKSIAFRKQDRHLEDYHGSHGGEGDVFEMPDPPYPLSDQALAEFQRVVPLLNEVMDLKQIDLGMISIYAREITKYWECEKVLQESGLTMVTSTGYQAQRPEVSIGKNALVSARNIAYEYGFTILSRKKIFEGKVPQKTKAQISGISRFQKRWDSL